MRRLLGPRPKIKINILHHPRRPIPVLTPKSALRQRGIFSIDYSRYVHKYLAYLKDTPGAIVRFLKHSMFLEAAIMFMRAKHIFHSVKNVNINLVSDLMWEPVVENLKSKISKMSRQKLLDGLVDIAVVADALSAVAIVDGLNSVNLFSLFLDSRESLVQQLLRTCLFTNRDHVISVFCKIFEVMQLTLAQCGSLFMHVPSTSTTTIAPPFPLLNNTLLNCGVLGMPIPDPREEISFLEIFRTKLKGSLVMVDLSFISYRCSKWLDKCSRHTRSPVGDFYLVDVMESGHELIYAEIKIRETIQCENTLRESLGWLEFLFDGSEVEFPWKIISQLFLKPPIDDLWTEVLEYHFMERMSDILEPRFMELSKSLGLKDSILRIAEATPSSQGYPEQIDSDEIGRILKLLDTCCESALGDFLSFLASPNGSLRLRKLAPVLRRFCYMVFLTIIEELESEMNLLYDAMECRELSVESIYQSLFIGRLLLGIGKHSKQIPLILGSPESWMVADISGTPGDLGGSSKRETSSQTSAVYVGGDSQGRYLENFKRLTRDLSIKAHDIWISWISKRLSATLFSNLMKDETDLLRVGDGTLAAEEYPAESPSEMKVLGPCTPSPTLAAEEHSAESPSEMKVLGPCTPSPYVINFLAGACTEVSRVGEHLIDGIIMQNLASKLSVKVTETYGHYFLDEPMLSRDGVLQILLDLGFSADILSGGDSIGSKNVCGFSKLETTYKRSHDKRHTTKAVGLERKDWLTNGLVQRLDPIEWLMYEPYLAEIKRQSYLYYAVNFRFFVQLNPMYTEYLGFGVATPFLKSLLQVGSGSSTSTLKFGSMLTNGQVGRSSAILHSQACGLLSSFAQGRLYV